MPEPHRMRITSGGSTEGYVRFALAFLKDTTDRPLILHTLPPDTPQKKEGKQRYNGASGLHASTFATPRLISVVEKIKRAHDGALWQYTETGVLPGPREGVSLEQVLAGKTKPKMTHRAYLQITLSTSPLGLEEKRGVTCQISSAPPAAPELEAPEASAQPSANADLDLGEPVPQLPTDARQAKRKSDAGLPSSKRVRTA